jgi:hypothetical protein
VHEFCEVKLIFYALIISFFNYIINTINKLLFLSELYLSTAELSAGFDQLVLTKNPDQLAEDKHFILAWLNTIPPEQVQ